MLGSSPRPRPALKPELDDYTMLNFVGGGGGAGEGDEQSPCATARSNKLEARRDGSGGDGDQTHRDTDDDSSSTAKSAIWRGRGNSYTREALSTLEPAKADGDNGALNGSAYDKKDAADRTTDGDEARMYRRTLGSSVSVLDEKDAVLRTGGQRFAGEDPIRGRLRATDPFLWMGRLNAGTSAISGLIDKANDALKNLDGGSDGSDCDTSDGRGSGRQRVDRMQDIRSAGKEIVGPSSRGSRESQQMGKLDATAEGFSEGDGAENDSDDGGDNGQIDRSCASSDRLSSSGNIAVEQLSSTMSAYSQSMETRRVIAGGVMIEEEEEEEESEQEENVRRSTTSSVFKPTVVLFYKEGLWHVCHISSSRHPAATTCRCSRAGIFYLLPSICVCCFHVERGSVRSDLLCVGRSGRVVLSVS